jgi:hypothetical protein
LAEEASRTVKQLRKVLDLPEPDPSRQPSDEMARMMQDIEESERLMIEVNKRGLSLSESNAPGVDKSAQKVERLLLDYGNLTTPALARMPQPMRTALEQMQPALEKLAVVDASFLTEDQHPVRLFLEAICRRSLIFTGDFADGFTSFFTPVQKMLEAVAQVAQPSAKVYEQALARLQPLWQQQDAELKTLQDKKERSLAQQEVRKQLASRLAFELVSRHDAGDAPVPVKQFLMGPWAQVLARAKLHPQYPQDEQRYDYAVALLLWSVSARRAAAHKEELIQRTPELIQMVQTGLASVEHPQGNIDAFLVEMKKLHEAVMASEVVDDGDDTYPPEPPAEADLSDMMMLTPNSPAKRSEPPAAPSYQSDLNLL